ncbi:MAG TPA: glutamate-5-semialdehyde dehydrogenase [Thermoguttaceae bacterium]|nr:glutamate-5-semialdehyde dehydrogenase [Thermoguttaceae bacterium]
MATNAGDELKNYCLDVAGRARRAAGELGRVTGAQKSQWLRRSAELFLGRSLALTEANHRDVKAATEFGLTDAQVDRLRLTPARIEAMARAMEEVALLPEPIGEVIGSSVRPSGLEVQKVRVPLGVIFFIYESRPNVTADAAALCVKSGNAVILRGGKEAAQSNAAIAQIMAEAASEAGLPADAVQLVATPDREAVGHFLNLPEYIDVAIPRGGEGLIRRVTAEAKMPVIKHFAGNCHVYLDASADAGMAVRLVVNAKTQRMGVCNAAESLVVHAAAAERLLPAVAKALVEKGVELRGCERTRKILEKGDILLFQERGGGGHGAGEKSRMSPFTLATEEDFAAEYLGPILSIKVVDSLDEAVEHINRYGSKHTEAIVTRDLDAARAFAARIDSAAVMINASTRLHDGGQFGLGAEIGISTDKIHARGPCGINELTSYKYVCYGTGQVRE